MEASERAANAVRQQLTYVQLAQIEADKVVADIVPNMILPAPPKIVVGNYKTKSTTGPMSRVGAVGAPTSAAGGLDTPPVRKPRGRPPGSGKHQNAVTASGGIGGEAANAAVMTARKVQKRMNDSEMVGIELNYHYQSAVNDCTRCERRTKR
jgi:hypothetical protein